MTRPSPPTRGPHGSRPVPLSHRNRRRAPGSFLAGLALGASGLACTELLEDEAAPAAPGVVVQPDVSNRNFGIHCTKSYEASWMATLAEGFTICDRFASEASKGAIQEYYYNLTNKQFYWHTGGDGYDNSIEDVDLFFAFTHGNAQPTWSEWVMWDQYRYAYSSSMELGDELRGNSVFATYSSLALRIDDATWTRWDSVFGGGLRMALGSHGIIFAGSAERDVGKVFAQYLNSGYSFRTAWLLGFDLMAYNHNDVAVLATGTTASNCTTRRDNLTWNNFSFTSYPRLTTGSIAYWCSYAWDDV